MTSFRWLDNPEIGDIYELRCGRFTDDLAPRNRIIISKIIRTPNFGTYVDFLDMVGEKHTMHSEALLTHYKRIEV